jgi:adenine/guanine/hypoxanthine permease
MLRNVTDINWVNLSDSLPTVLTMIGIPLTFSIVDGIGIGIISYVIIKLAYRKYQAINLMLASLAILFIVYFVFKAF